MNTQYNHFTPTHTVTISHVWVTYLNNRAIERLHSVHQIDAVLPHSFLAVHRNPFSLVLTVQHRLVFVLKSVVASCEKCRKELKSLNKEHTKMTSKYTHARIIQTKSI